MKRTVSTLLLVLVLAGLMVAVTPPQSYALKTEGDGDTMYVSAIDMWNTVFRNRYVVYAEVAIEDDQGIPVKSARVYVQFKTPNNTPIDRSGVTGKDGTAVVSINARTVGTYSATVMNVTHRQLTYTPDDNVETSETLYVP